MNLDTIGDFLKAYPVLKDFLFVVVLFLFSGVLYYVTKSYVLRFVKYLFSQTKTDWDEQLFDYGVFNDLPQLVPALVLSQGIDYLPRIQGVGQKLINVWIIIILLKFVDKFLSGALMIYNRYEISYRRPLKTYVQVIKIILYIAVGILIISILVGQSPWIFLSGLGALTAVLMLMFQDTILGFVASIQITSNDLIRVGDWLEVPEFGADGDVIEIALHTVKVQNWDKTITTIPSHKLVSNSFKNWRGMKEAGGRRIKRSILIDQTSVTFCTDEMIKKFSKIHVLKDYIEQKQKEIAEYNLVHGIDSSVLVNGRRMTNLGTFRAYLAAYLRHHPGIHPNLTFIVRQLQPTRQGIPMEIYVFTNDTRWVTYEGIQADIFDHVLAVIPEFGLRIAQDPTGYDLQQLFAMQN